MEVGIRELKARLSEYVGRAAAGEAFTVTDRGEPKALLLPLTERDTLAAGLVEGWIIRRSAKAPGRAAPVSPAPDTARTEELLAEDRGD